MSKYLIICLLSTVALWATNEADNWYFGDYCAVKFVGKDKVPTFVSGSQMSTVEGCATISDISGKLLFYTDGISIWNNTNVQMPNGSGLHGNKSSTQSAVIVQKPGSYSIFYVFTVDAQGAYHGLKYSTVDMSLDDGRGDVTLKNIAIEDTVTEKITAVKHSNGRDNWIIAHEWKTNIFMCYLLTDTGLITQPVITAIGEVHSGDQLNAVGYMKASPSGKHLGLCIYESGIVELFKFNNSTGEITSPITLSNPNFHTCYGIEFSPDGSKLYFSVSREESKIFQIDIMAGSDLDIRKSLLVIAEYPLPYYYQALQFAPDGKIYVAKRDKSYLSAINKPNNKGISCDFIESAFDLLGRKCRQGFPSFNQSYQDVFLQIHGNKSVCEGETLILRAKVSDSISFSWSGPDGLSSTDSTVLVPNVNKKHEGFYKVVVSVGKIIKTDSIFIKITSRPIAKISPSDTAYICKGDAIYLISDCDSINYKLKWSSGENDSRIQITMPGLYYLIVSNKEGCSDTAYVNVIEKSIPKITLKINGPSKICNFDETEIYCEEKFQSYLWSTGEKSDRIVVNSPGKYYLSCVDDFGCMAKDSINIEGYDIAIIAPRNYDYGEVLIGSESRKTFYLINTGEDSIYITSIRKILNSSEFLLSTKSNLPIWIKKNDTLKIDIAYKPTEINVHLDSIEIITAFPCNVYSKFQISGLSGSDLTLISIPDTSAKIGSRMKIPVFSQLFSNNVYNFSARMTISFNASVFIPDKNQNLIKNNQIIDGRRILEIETDQVMISKEKSIICSIAGEVLLSTGQNELKIDSFEWDNPNIERDLKHGSLKAYGICKPELSSIMHLSQSSVSLFPNPANDQIRVSLESTIEDNVIYEIKVINLYGKINYLSNSEDTKSLFVDLSSYNDGYYLLELKTKYGLIRSNFIKIR